MKLTSTRNGDLGSTVAKLRKCSMEETVLLAEGLDVRAGVCFLRLKSHIGVLPTASAHSYHPNPNRPQLTVISGMGEKANTTASKNTKIAIARYVHCTFCRLFVLSSTFLKKT